MQQVRDKAKRITKLFFEDRTLFYTLLEKEITAHIIRADKEQLIPAIRLNVASDLDWSNIAAKFSNSVFYDYTKSKARFDQYLKGNWPSNYHLTFSASEHTEARILRDFLVRGGNVAQVFNTRYVNKNNQDELPRNVVYVGQKFVVIDADKHDIRLPMVDGNGVVCGLRLKGMLASKDRARKNKFAIEGTY